MNSGIMECIGLRNYEGGKRKEKSQKTLREKNYMNSRLQMLEYPLSS